MRKINDQFSNKVTMTACPCQERNGVETRQALPWTKFKKKRKGKNNNKNDDDTNTTADTRVMTAASHTIFRTSFSAYNFSLLHRLSSTYHIRRRSPFFPHSFPFRSWQFPPFQRCLCWTSARGAEQVRPFYCQQFHLISIFSKWNLSWLNIETPDLTRHLSHLDMHTP